MAAGGPAWRKFKASSTHICKATCRHIKLNVDNVCSRAVRVPVDSVWLKDDRVSKCACGQTRVASNAASLPPVHRTSTARVVVYDDVGISACERGNAWCAQQSFLGVEQMPVAKSRRAEVISQDGLAWSTHASGFRARPAAAAPRAANATGHGVRTLAHWELCEQKTNYDTSLPSRCDWPVAPQSVHCSSLAACLTLGLRACLLGGLLAGWLPWQGRPLAVTTPSSQQVPVVTSMSS